MHFSQTSTAACIFQGLLAPATAFGPLKYKEWFNGWRDGYYVGEQCLDQIATYWNNNGTFPYRCQVALDCIIENTSGSAMQEMSSSLVLLGLTPTILSQLGPKLSESSMLSYQRPVLSFLLSMGAPTVSPGRIFSYDDPFGALETVVKGQPLLRSASSSTPHRQTLIIILEYLCALGAICNIIYISVELGWRSVLSWACTTNYVPFTWVHPSDRSSCLSQDPQISQRARPCTRNKRRTETISKLLAVLRRVYHLLWSCRSGH
jgi:hypothetical protein